MITQLITIQLKLFITRMRNKVTAEVTETQLIFVEVNKSHVCNAICPFYAYGKSALM